MQIVISNKIRLIGAPDELKVILMEELVTPNPKFVEALKQGYSTYNIPKDLFTIEMLMDGSINVPRGYKMRLLELIKDLGVTADVVDKRTLLEPNYDLDSSAITLKPYQFEPLKAVVKNSEGVIVAPAGSGKTVIGLSLVLLTGQKTLWLTHTGPLANQTLGRANQFIPGLTEDDIGFIGTGKWKVGNVFTVAMVQTLIRNMSEIHKLRNEFGMLIGDEIHHFAAETFNTVVSNFNPYYLYGLTATEARRDKLEKFFFQTIGPVIHRVGYDVVKEVGGIMVPQVLVKRLDTNPTLELVQSFNELIDVLMFDNIRNNLIVDDVISAAKDGHKCIVVTDRREHAEILFEKIQKRWSTVGIATGKYSKKKVNYQIKQLESDAINVLVVTSSLLGEGFDYNLLDRGFLGLPFRNEVRTEQIMGRIQRVAPGKVDSILYDYVDNHSLLKHQFFNRGDKGCRMNIYKKLGAVVKNC